MDQFDYMKPAELFHPTRRGKNSPLTFYRFDTSAEAIKFAVEELSEIMFFGAVIEQSEGERLDRSKIGDLYRSSAFPLCRRGV